MAKQSRVTQKKPRPANVQKRISQAHGSKADTRVRAAHTPDYRGHSTKSEKQNLKSKAARSYI